MQPYFEQDGIALEYDAPTLWLAHGELFRDLATASLDRVVGRTIDDWMPRAPEARTLRRLQQEMQMLLYTHAVNERARARRPAAGQFVLGQRHRRAARGARRRGAAGPAGARTTCAMPRCWATGAPGPPRGSSSMRKECARLLASAGRAARP